MFFAHYGGRVTPWQLLALPCLAHFGGRASIFDGYYESSLRWACYRAVAVLGLAQFVGRVPYVPVNRYLATAVAVARIVKRI